MNIDERMELLKRRLNDKMNSVQQKSDDLMNRYAFNDNASSIDYGLNVKGDVASEPATEFKFCPDCGYKAEENANYCSQCGARLDGNDVSQPTDPMDELNGLLDEIMEQMRNVGLDNYVIYTNDYCGELDWEEVSEKLSDTTLALELYFKLASTYDGGLRIAILPRAMHIVDDELLFDIEDEKDTMDGDLETLWEFPEETVDAIVNSCGVEAVIKCLKSIRDYAFDPDVVSLNLMANDDE